MGVTAQVAKTTDGKPASKTKCNYPWSHADREDKIPWNTGLLYKFYAFLWLALSESLVVLHHMAARDLMNYITMWYTE